MEIRKIWNLLKYLLTPQPPNERLYNEMEKWCPACHHCPMHLYEMPHELWIARKTKAPAEMPLVNVNIFCADCGQGYNMIPAIRSATRIHKDESFIRKNRSA
jgi:hypothetical protein